MSCFFNGICVVCFDWGCVEHVFEGICVCFHSLWLKPFFCSNPLTKRIWFLPKDPCSCQKIPAFDKKVLPWKEKEKENIEWVALQVQALSPINEGKPTGKDRPEERIGTAEAGGPLLRKGLMLRRQRRRKKKKQGRRGGGI